MSESAEPRRPEHRVRVGRAPAPPAVTRAVETVRLDAAIKVVREAVRQMAVHAFVPGTIRDRIEADAMSALKEDARR